MAIGAMATANPRYSATDLMSLQVDLDLVERSEMHKAREKPLLALPSLPCAQGANLNVSSLAGEAAKVR